MSQLSSTLFGSSAVRGDSPRAGNARAVMPQSNEASGNFSQLLRDYEQPSQIQSKASEAPPAPQPATPEPAKPAAAAATAQGPSETQRQEAKLSARRAAEPAKPAGPKPGQASESPEAKAESGGTTQTETASTASDTKVDETEEERSASSTLPSALLPTNLAASGALGLVLPAGKAAGADATVDLDTEGDARTSIDRRTRGPARPDPLARGQQADEQKQQADQDQSQRGFAADFARELNQATPAQAQKARIETAEAAKGASIDALLSAQAPAAGELRGGSTATSPERVMLAHSLYEPGFAPEMAARLSVLSADGVQEAQLHLNPAEMGPVAVQIVVEGQQAQISFHAEQADTRAVLEQALPDLAAALRDSGLTLSGGGVFQQAQGQGQTDSRGGANTGGTRRGDDSSQPIQARAPGATRLSRGVVDLYA